MTQMALAWVLRRPEVSSAIVGASRPEQVAANAAGSGITLSQEALDRIDAILKPVVLYRPVAAKPLWKRVIGRLLRR
jgi:aryl-alcohol dehydrogenase-like predicted oxidoreductase